MSGDRFTSRSTYRCVVSGAELVEQSGTPARARTQSTALSLQTVADARIMPDARTRDRAALGYATFASTSSP